MIEKNIKDESHKMKREKQYEKIGEEVIKKQIDSFSRKADYS